MAKKGAGVDLIQRYADKVAEGDKRSLAERAAERLSALRKSDDADTVVTPPASHDQVADVLVPTVNDGLGSDEPVLAPDTPALPEELGTDDPAGSSVLTAAGRRAKSNRETAPAPAQRETTRPADDTSDRTTGEDQDVGTVENVAASVEAVDDEDAGPSVLTAAGRRQDLEVRKTPVRKKSRSAGGGKTGAAATRQESRSQDPEEAVERLGSEGGGRVEIDLMRVQLSGNVSPMAERSRISEEFRVIKRPLLLNAFARGSHAIPRGHLIMVTSPRPGEGKTFTSLNLAMSMASERELYVLLVDADVHRGTLMDRLGVKSKRGLVDMLVDERLSLQDAMLRTNIPNLTLLPSGTSHPQANELLASQRMANLMSEIADRYPDRVIIIDTPPVLASSEAGVLAMHVGQIVMVVEAGSTSRAAVEQALPLIGAGPHVNFLLNKATFYMGSDRFGMYTADGVYGNQ